MSYCVINNTKGVYIRLNENGVPVTCTKDSATWFQTRNKAKNILNSLPKTLRRFHFFISEEIEPINNNSTNDIKDVKHDTKEIKVIEGTNNDVNDEILEWLNKFGICDDIINEARKRITEVNISISNKDKKINNILHEIELEKNNNACDGYYKYKALRDVLRERRKLKDELLILSGVMNMNFKNFDNNNIKSAVKGLAKRKFSLRIIDDEMEECKSVL